MTSISSSLPASVASCQASKRTDVRGIGGHDRRVRRERVEFGAERHRQRVAKRC